LAGLITYNGQLLMRGGGLAGNKACCCVGVVCYCVTQYTNYGMTVVARWVQCYRLAYYNPTLNKMIYPDGIPGGWGDSPCQPNSFGWFHINSSNQSAPPWPVDSTPPGFPSSTGCGGQGGAGFSITPIDSLPKATACTRVLPPP
jgi:hypothetical protein